MSVARLVGPLAGKVMTIGGLSLLLLLPLSQVRQLVMERAGMRDAAADRVATGWGGVQIVGAPVLSVPFETVVQQGDRIVTRLSVFRALLADADLSGALQPQLRHIGIYTVPVYETTVSLRGSAQAANLADLLMEHPERTVLWDRAQIFLPISDPRGIREVSTARWAAQILDLQPGGYDVLAGVTAVVDLSALRRGVAQEFAFEFKLAGSRSLRVLPLAERTTVQLQSSWQHPNFSAGAYLPVQYRLDTSGFDAHWQVLKLNREFPQHWLDTEVGSARLCAAGFGVDLYQPVDAYQRNERASKYALLFIALTLMSVFLWEHLGGLRLHAMQYLLVGLALCVFYLLLIALSEHLTFGFAYFSGAVALAVLIGVYLGGATRNRRAGLITSSALGCVYALLYLLVLSEQYALLLGALLVFIALAVIMLVTRKLDWHSINARSDS